MKTTLKIFALIMVISGALAAPFTLKDEGTGATYQCGGGSPIEPDCISKMSEYCDGNTSFTQTQCFEKSSEACSQGASADCVVQTAEYCDAHTSHTQTECFERAVDACGGSPSAIRDLMDSTRRQALSRRH